MGYEDEEMYWVKRVPIKTFSYQNKMVVNCDMFRSSIEH